MYDILVADDFPNLVDIWCRKFENYSQFNTRHVVGVCSATEALEHLGKHDFDVLVTDLEFRGDDKTGLGLISEAPCKTVVCTRYRERQSVQAAKIAGADVYVVKGNLTDLCPGKGVKIALRGETGVDSCVTECAESSFDFTDKLSGRHLNTIYAMAESTTVKEAAGRMGVTPSSLYNYRSQIRSILDLDNTKKVDEIAGRFA